jgi:hypothetical protein
MQQGRNAAESAFIRPKPALARKPARNGVGFKEIAPPTRYQRPMAGSPN